MQSTIRLLFQFLIDFAFDVYFECRACTAPMNEQRAKKGRKWECLQTIRMRLPITDERAASASRMHVQCVHSQMHIAPNLTIQCHPYARCLCARHFLFSVVAPIESTTRRLRDDIYFSHFISFMFTQLSILHCNFIGNWIISPLAGISFVCLFFFSLSVFVSFSFDGYFRNDS